MTDNLSPWESLRVLALAEPEQSPADVASAFLASHPPEDAAPIIEAEVNRIRRSVTRTIESRVFGQGSTRRTFGEIIDDLALRKELLSESFVLPDGRFVRWGAATIEDHQARIGMLLHHIAGVELTVERHRAATNEILTQGVTCLDEIDSGEEDAA